jgi:predicted alpha/beta-fold hydrolase
MENVIRNNWKGIMGLDEGIYVPMFGFKDRQDYYRAGSLAG